MRLELNGSKLRKLECFCNQCEYKSSNKESVKTHTKSVHEAKEFPCSQCEYKSNDENTLKSHIEQNHDETEWQISTQELIEDSRTRRNLRKDKILKCKHCDWTILKKKK